MRRQIAVALLILCLTGLTARAYTLLSGSGGSSNLTSLDCGGSACGSATGSPVTSIAATFSTTAGSGVAVACVIFNGTAGTLGMTSSHLTWTLNSTNSAANINHIYFWTAPYTSNVTSETVTATGLGNNFASIQVFGIGNAKTSSFFDPNGSATVYNSSDPLSVSTTNANDFIFGCFRMNSTASPTAGSGWTTIVGANFELTEYKTVTSTQSGLSVTLTTGSGDSNGGIASAIESQ